MAIHYSSELGASCTSMGRKHRRPKSWSFSHHQGLQLQQEGSSGRAGLGRHPTWTAAVLWSGVKSGQRQPCVSGCGFFFLSGPLLPGGLRFEGTTVGFLGTDLHLLAIFERPFHSCFTRAIFRSGFRSPVEFKRNENSSLNNNAACFRTKINLNNSASHCAIPHRLKYAKTQSSLGRLHTLRLWTVV